MQVASSSLPFGAVIIGSGATGGWAAKKLTAAGMRVALLEADATVTPKDFTEHTQTWQMPFLGYSPEINPPEIKMTLPFRGLCYSCRETTQEKPFLWIRMRVPGGRSLSWGRQSYRMSDLEFKAASHHGYGEDWPISYADLVPYYEEVGERLPQPPHTSSSPTCRWPSPASMQRKRRSRS